MAKEVRGARRYLRKLKSFLRPHRSRRLKRPPNSKKILRHVAELHRSGSLQAALDYLNEHGLEAHAHVGKLLRASAAEDDLDWQRNMNAYLSQYGLSDVELARSQLRSRWHRLEGPSYYGITEGPLISVIMTTFNAENVVEHAAQSILKQTWKNIELIIVDDASTDRTRAVLEDLSKKDRRVHVLYNAANVGPYVSKNRALSIASGDYITCQDSDDWAHPQRLERQLAALKATAGAVANFALALRTTPNLEFHKFGGIGASDTDGVAHVALISGLFESSSFRERLGYWDTVRFGADIELYHRARTIFGDACRTAPILGLLMLDHQGSITSDPIHGTRVGASKTLSPVRIEYRKAFLEWHRDGLPTNSCLEFPHVRRKFSAPEAMLVDATALRCVLEADEGVSRASPVA